MAKLTVVLRFAGGGLTILEPAYTDSDVLESLELLVNDRPVMVTPFHIHGDRLHTICRRLTDPDPDGIDEVSW